MLEIEKLTGQMCKAFLEATLRIQRLEEALPHSPGTIVHKGPGKKYTYWQFYQNGRQRHHYVKQEDLEQVEKKIAVMKAQKEKLKILRRFAADMKKALRAVKIQWQIVIEAYELKMSKRKEDRDRRKALAKKIKNKRYADNYKHLTDRGEYVASKSEQMIANMLYAYGIPYEYEVRVETATRTHLVDLKVWNRDGKEIYWEHAGMLEDPEYAARFDEKLKDLETVGIRMLDNLIVTRDVNGALDMDMIREVIEFHHLK